MALSITYQFSGDADASADQLNQNFADVVAKFTEGSGGIADGDIASSAAISGLKMSTVSGKQIPTGAIANAAITDAKLASDSASPGTDANRAVGTDAIKNKAVTKGKVADLTLTLAQMAMTSEEVAFTLPFNNVATILSYTVHRATSGSNYVFYVNIAAAITGPSLSASMFLIDTTSPHAPATGGGTLSAIPTATRVIVAAYLADVTYGSNQFTGKLVVTHMARS